MAKAVAVVEAALETLPIPVERPDAEKGAVELLQEGMRESLILGRDTVRVAQEALRRDGEHVDPKLLRLGNDTGMALCRLGLRAAEGEFRARNHDLIGQLLAAIEAEKGEGPLAK